MKVNIILSPSQQKINRCAMGDSEADHCRLICEKVVASLNEQYECKAFIIPKMECAENEILAGITNASNDIVKNNPADFSYHLDVHTDGGYDGNGASAFYMSESGKAFIQKVHKEIATITPWDDSGCSYRKLWVLSMTVAVAGLIELSFHDRLTEAKYIHGHMPEISDALVRGIAIGSMISKKPIIPKTYVQIIQENSSGSADAWLKGIDAIKTLAEDDTNLGELEIFRFLPALIEKIGNK